MLKSKEKLTVRAKNVGTENVYRLLVSAVEVSVRSM